MPSIDGTVSLVSPVRHLPYRDLDRLPASSARTTPVLLLTHTPYAFGCAADVAAEAPASAAAASTATAAARPSASILAHAGKPNVILGIRLSSLVRFVGARTTGRGRGPRIARSPSSSCCRPGTPGGSRP